MASVHVPIPFCPLKLSISAPIPELLRTLPRPFDTYEQWVAFHHLDLAEMTDAQLQMESFSVAARIAFEGRCNPWFIERLAKVRSLLKEGAAR